jgi:4-amino-4-deoxy-L-arabinose transferase-like glycosyltransferase
MTFHWVTSSETASRPQHPMSRGVEIAALLLILALAAYLRLAGNADNPGWYADEGTHALIARSLATGRIQYMAIGQSTLLFAKLPLFESLLALIFRLGGDGIAALRTLTGVLGVVSVATLYGCVRWVKRDPCLALLAALLLAVYPQAVLYSRFGFSYNLIVPLVLLAFLGLWGYLDSDPQQTARRRRWLTCAAIAIGIGGVSDFWMFTLLVPMIAVVSTRRPRDLLWSLVLVCLPFGVYACLMIVRSLCARSSQAFLFDLGFTAFRLSRLSLWAQLRSLALNYATLISQSHWMALALVGMFLLRPARLQRLSLLFLLFPIVGIGRTEALVSLSAHYVIPLLPFVSFGVAVALREGVPYALGAIHDALSSLVRSWCWLPASLERALQQRRLLRGGAYLILVAVVASPFVTSTAYTIGQVSGGFSTAIDPFLIDPQDARAAGAYVNARTAADDVVIASPGLAWVIDAHTADPQMAMAYEGQATPHLPADIPAERFVFEPDYRQARFVVVDNYWYNWAVHNVAGVSALVREVQDWPLVFGLGAIEVYRNPSLER